MCCCFAMVCKAAHSRFAVLEWVHGGIVCTGDVVDEAALQDLIRAAVTLNLEGKSKAKPAACSRMAAR